MRHIHRARCIPEHNHTPVSRQAVADSWRRCTAILASAHYDARYFAWQAPQGEFGGWANLTKFRKYIRNDDRVLDFGCGGGFLLKNLTCRKRVGVEGDLAQRRPRPRTASRYTHA